MTVQNQKKITVNGFSFARSCNQDILVINKDKVDKDFLQISNVEWMAAVKSFKNNSTGYLYLYLASNCDKYTFALSSSDVHEKLGIASTGYKNAKKELIDLGYLILKTQDWKDKNNIVITGKDSGECYDFYTTPQKNDTVILPQIDEKSVISPQIEGVILPQTNPLYCDKPTPYIATIQQIDNIDNTDNIIDTGLSQQAAPTITKEKEQDSESAAAAITYWTKDRYVMWSLYHRQDPLPENLYIDGVELNKFLLRGRA